MFLADDPDRIRLGDAFQLLASTRLPICIHFRGVALRTRRRNFRMSLSITSCRHRPSFSLEIQTHLVGPVVYAESHGVDPLVIHEAALILRDASKRIEQPVAVDLLYGELFRETVVLGGEDLRHDELVLVKHWFHGILNDPPLLLGSRALSV